MLYVCSVILACFPFSPCPPHDLLGNISKKVRAKRVGAFIDIITMVSCFGANMNSVYL